MRDSRSGRLVKITIRPPQRLQMATRDHKSVFGFGMEGQISKPSSSHGSHDGIKAGKIAKAA
jgi:hypothetical protein